MLKDLTIKSQPRSEVILMTEPGKSLLEGSPSVCVLAWRRFSPVRQGTFPVLEVGPDPEIH